ncbi:MAG: C4-type zinc ribbon domain-containing protein [Deltaproteobacteria bacterium]|nr:C4-type zinc ribbon domain-containing protein [Deltaproteobacteria bacterium]
MRDQIRLLIALQKAESEMMRIDNRKKVLPGQLIKLDEEFQAVYASVEENRKKFEELNKNRKEHEDKLKRGHENLKKAKERLSEVKTNKEYQSMLKEIEGIDLKNSETEDEVLVLLEKIDQIKVGVQIREREFDLYRQEYEVKKKQIEDDLRSLDDQFSVCQQTSQDLKKQVHSDIIKRYESIKNIRNGLAVVLVWKEVCHGCHMNIPPQMYIELQRDADIKYCPQCNRIIYWEDQSKKVSE